MNTIFFLRGFLCISGSSVLLEGSASCMRCESVDENVEPRAHRGNYSESLVQAVKTIARNPLTRCILERALLCTLEAWSTADLFVPLGITALVGIDLGYGSWMPHMSVLKEFQRTVRQTPAKSFGKFALNVGLKGGVHYGFFTSASVLDLSKKNIFALPFEERGLVPFEPYISSDLCVPVSRTVCGIYDAHLVVYSPRICALLDLPSAVPPALHCDVKESAKFTYENTLPVCVPETRLVALNYREETCRVNPSVSTHALHPVASYFKRTASYIASNISSFVQYAKDRWNSCTLAD